MKRAWFVFVLGVLAYVAVIVWAAVDLPAEVASKFGFTGEVGGWSSKTSQLWVMGGLLVALILPMPLLGLIPAKHANMGGHEEYWRQPENAPAFRRILLGSMLEFGGGFALFMGTIMASTVLAHRSTPPHTGAWVPPVVLVYLVGTAVWSFVLYQRFARPARAWEQERLRSRRRSVRRD